MKKLILLILALASMLATVSCGAARTMKTVKGSGTLTTRTIPAPDFDAVSVSNAIRVYITDKIDVIEIEADDNLIDLVRADAAGKELRIGFDSKFNSFSNIHVTVRIPANGKIRSLRASSAASIVTETGLQAGDFRIDASSASSIEAAVKARSCSMNASSAAKVQIALKADECTLDTSSSAGITASLTVGACRAEASSASRIALTGTVRDLDVDTSSAAKLNAEEAVCENARIDTSSGSSVRVQCTGRLRADASSGSSIRYTGKCQAETSTSSGGSIRKY